MSSRLILSACALSAALCVSLRTARADSPASGTGPVEGDYVVRDLKFAPG